MNNYLDKYVNFLTYCQYDFIGGPKLIKINWIVNIFKALTLPFIIFLMWIFQNYSIGAYLYCALHGSYGIVWFIKDITFPDSNFQKYCTIPSAIGGCGVLIAYWIIPLIQCTGYGMNQPTNLQIFIIVLIYLIGINLMMMSDCQKYYILQYQKCLITNGQFKYNRNPNYTGEILIYLSFAMLTNNIFCYTIVLCSWIFMFYPFMMRKDYSFQKKQGWKNYKQQSYLFFWKISNNYYLDLMIYLLIFILVIFIYK